ncbi:MAG: hypothetical protein ACRBB0_12725 [Pelagimonas sp.]|uniref:hypothetical protein n=1 Tax=Pelagimonas sp. TaxID=2073170 RepID=UPI003D6A8FDE
MRVVPIILASCIGALAGLSACSPDKAGRILAPEQYGMTCVSATICLEDTGRKAQAEALYAQAARTVQAQLVPFKAPPRMLFCSTKACSAQFGEDHSQALTLGTYGILIREDGWHGYTLRHEMIHHLQAERFGIRATSYTLPKWYIEGMAYTLAGDPRQPLPRPELEDYREAYKAWIAAGNTWSQPPK